MQKRFVPGSLTIDSELSIEVGVIDGQLHDDDGKAILNAVWFNQDGQRIGSGDLDADDLRNLAAHLSPSELLFILDGETMPDSQASWMGVAQMLPHVWVVLTKNGSFEVTGATPEHAAAVNRIVSTCGLIERYVAPAVSLAN